MTVEPHGAHLRDAFHRRETANRWDRAFRWDAAAVMFFPGRGRSPGESRSVVQRFDVDSVHHGPSAETPPTPASGTRGGRDG
jgi:hypothetical protein